MGRRQRVQQEILVMTAEAKGIVAVNGRSVGIFIFQQGRVVGSVMRMAITAVNLGHAFVEETSSIPGAYGSYRVEGGVLAEEAVALVKDFNTPCWPAE